MRTTFLCKKNIALCLGAILLPSVYAQHCDSDNLLIATAGGALTVPLPIEINSDGSALADPLRKQVRRGEAFFNSSFFAAPSKARQRDGLGPLFNASACANCHSRSGRRFLAEDGKDLSAMQVVQFSQQQADGRWAPHAIYGENLNPAAIEGLVPEGRASIDWQPTSLAGMGPLFSTLRQPQLVFHNMAQGEPGANTVWSVRTAQPMFGMGLLAGTPDADILAYADPDDTDNNGISGRPNWINIQGKTQLGRFGWKANHPTLRSQITAALLNEQGITSSDRPEQNCSSAQLDCRNMPDGGKPEISDADLEAILLFVRLFPVPQRRGLNSQQVRQGAALFTGIACDQCHRPTLATAAHTIAALSEQTFYPYTDLLLHDMGKELADHRPDHSANGFEWRTAPLWGVGLPPALGLPVCYLHDCRAATLEEAILWHGGEGASSRAAYTQLNTTQRQAVIAFLKSL